MGVHKVRAKLADGSTAFYYYAWRGGPRLDGEPGSDAFIRSYHEAHGETARYRGPIKTINELIAAYLRSAEYDQLAGSTRYAYTACLKNAGKRFNDLPIRAIDVKRMRSHFVNWRDEMKEHPRSADMHISALSALLTWASDEMGLIDQNHAKGIKRLSKANPRADIVWEKHHIACIPLIADPVRAVVWFALATGQRQEDILTLPKQMPGNEFIELKQGKRGARVFIYRSATINTILDMAGEHDAITHFASSRGTPWTKDGFKTSFGRQKKRVGIEGVTFHDLRGTFENRCWESECTEAEAYSVTGRELKSSQSANAYFARSKKLSKAAILKVESTFWVQNCKTPVKRSKFGVV